MTGFLGPGYAQWSNCGVGSSVTIENLSEMAGHFGPFRAVSIMKTTLVALDAEKATVRMEVQSAPNAGSFEMNDTVEIPARPPSEPEEPLRSGYSSEDGTEHAEVTSVSWKQMFKGTTPRESEETVEVAGRSLPCRRIDHATTRDGEPLTITFWTSDQVPGGVVRMEARTGRHVTKMTVTAFEKR